MKLTRTKILWGIGFIGWISCAAYLFWPNHSENSRQARIYDESADGAKQVSDALAIARRENKRVLLQFGANWCVWCHRLHNLFDSDRIVRKILKADYIVVLIDVNGGHNAETVARFDHPTQLGLPVIVILDVDGKKLVTQDTGSLAADGKHDREKVVAFLQQWKATR